MNKDLQKVFLWLWIFYSTIFFSVLVIQFFLPAEKILTLLPPCEWQVKYGKPCFFCGMTRAFIEISNGNIGTAYEYNHGSILLFLILLINDIFFIAFLLRKAYFLKIKSKGKL